MRFWVFCLLAASLACFFIPAGSAEAFCVYNKSNEEVSVIQQSGGKDCWGFCPWQANIKPGERACCNWQDEKCNKKGKKDAVLSFSVPALYEDNSYYCRDVEVKAGGWLTIKGKDGDITCHAHY